MWSIVSAFSFAFCTSSLLRVVVSDLGIEITLAFVEQFFAAKETLLDLFQLFLALLGFCGDLLGALLSPRLGFFGDLFGPLFRVEHHLADLELHRTALAQENEHSQEITNGNTRGTRRAEEEEKFF